MSNKILPKRVVKRYYLGLAAYPLQPLKFCLVLLADFTGKRYWESIVRPYNPAEPVFLAFPV